LEDEVKKTSPFSMEKVIENMHKKGETGVIKGPAGEIPLTVENWKELRAEAKALMAGRKQNKAS
jgi:hypothetical protein